MVTWRTLTFLAALRVGRHVGGEFTEQRLHGGDASVGYDEGDAGVAHWADRAEDPGGLVPHVADAARAYAALVPDPPVRPTLASS